MKRFVIQNSRICLQAFSARHYAKSTMPPSSHKAPSYEGKLAYEDVVNLRKTKVNIGTQPYYSKPLLIHHGHMQWLWDSNGQRYLDLFGGIVTVSVGHCHPRVCEAAEKQMRQLWHTTNIYLYPSIYEYSEKLLSTLPSELNCCYFVNSGSEANDLALLMARLYTGRFEIVSLRNAYHGASPFLMGVTAHNTWRYNTPTGFGSIHTMNPDPYIGPWGGKACRDSPVQTTRSCDCGANQCHACDMYVNQLEDVLRFSSPKEGVAGMFVESIQGVGGSVQFPKDFVKRSFDLIRSWGGVCISDEVQTGFGRTGTHFWGFQGHGVVPDIVTMAKGMGNGFPMAAVVTTPEIAKVISKALFFNTFGGNPIAGAVGSAVLDVIEEEKLQNNSHVLGTELLLGLSKLRDKFSFVGDVRGKGLMIGIEFVDNKESRAPLSPEKTIKIFDDIREKGVLVGRGGIHSNVIRLKPPMCITKEDVEFALSVFEDSFSKFET